MVLPIHLLRSCRCWKFPKHPSELKWLSNVGYNLNGKDSDSKTHWLDKHFPNVRPWLQKQSRNWWIHGIRTRCNEIHGLQDQKDRISLYLEKAYHTYLQKYSYLYRDGPSHTHLQMACLVLATYKVLLPWVKNQKIVLDIITDQMGASSAPLLRGLLHSSLFLRSRLLGHQPFAIMTRMMRSLKFDMGAAWNASLTQDAKETRLEIDSCLYYYVFSSEDVPQLSSTCCCSQDKTWFEGMEYHKVGYLQVKWLSKGDPKCCLVLKELS